MKRSSFAVGLMMSTFLVSGCQTIGGAAFPGFSEVSGNGDSAVTRSARQPSAIQALVQQSQDALADNNLEEASRYINLALKLDITSSDLQFMNGLVYHLMGKAGDASKYPLAEQGYRQALRFDPGNLSAQYQLGLLYMDQRRYGLAQGHIAAVAVHRGDDPAVLYSLASASYYARDPRTAEGALKRLMELAPEAAKKPEVLKARALALAAMDDRAAAGRFAAVYRKLASGGRQARHLDRRLDGWRSFYESDVRVLPAQYGGTGQSDPYGSYQANPANPYGSPQSPYGASSNPYAQPGAAASAGTAAQGQDFAGNDMVVVDVVLIGTQEDIRDSRGINLLNGLQLQFGNPLTGTAGLSYSRNNINDKIDGGLDENTTTITSLINIPAVTYSLNIANALNARNQVLAKPSLVAQAGQTSEFFSGTEILAAAVSGGNGDSVSVQKEVGVKLAVTPEVLPDDMIRLHVVAERTFLTDPSNSVVFEFRLDTTKTNVNSTVTMKFGETLILGGLSERETSNSSDGVPGLMDIPGLNYLFSERVKREFERSILILLTPRRPHYTRQAVNDRAEVEEKMSDLEKDISRLHKRHKDWFTPRPTFDGIVDSLKGQEFFEEFRAGDVEIQSWRNDPANQEHIALVQRRLLGN
jgi:general secretion pathway protein D